MHLFQTGFVVHVFFLGMCWAPHSANHIATGSDDHQALIWDVQQAARGAGIEGVMRYEAAGAVNQIQWSYVHPTWLAICCNKNLELLRIE